MKRNKFVHKKIGDIENYSTYSDVIKWQKKSKSLINIFVTILCVLCIWYLSKYIIHAWEYVIHAIWKSTITVVSKSLGQEMKEDEYGNVNVMLIWYWWWDHAGGYLADSIIVASWNKKLWAITMISVPRDLYVHNEETRTLGRINEVFSRGVGRKHEFETWSIIMMKELESIIWIDISYYALIDFAWFENMIDRLWWVEVDVPKTIHDTTYPTEDLGYTTFHIDSWVQLLSGEKALMYARSRHSTSDFDRSLRQQQIIKSVIHKILEQGFKPSKIKELYADYTAMVKTNISLDEMLGLAQYANDIEHIFTYGLTTDCSNVAYRYSYPGCFLYSPDPINFGWAMVILPVGADKTNISYYEYIKNFAFYVMHNQEYLLENPKIVVWNGIDKQYIRQQRVKANWYANQVAVKLRKYALDVPSTANAPSPYLNTELYVLGTGEYDDTINILKTFVPLDNIVIFNDMKLLTWFIAPQEIYQEQADWTDLLIVLWNSYIDATKGKRFDYYK